VTASHTTTVDSTLSQNHRRLRQIAVLTCERNVPDALRPCGMHPHPGHPTARTTRFTLDLQIDPPTGRGLLTDGDHSVPGRLNKVLAASRGEPIRSAMARETFAVRPPRQHESQQIHGPPTSYDTGPNFTRNREEPVRPRGVGGAHREGVKAMLDKKNRVRLVMEVAETVSDLSWNHANILLRTYGLPGMPTNQFDSPVAETINDASDAQLIELASDLELLISADGAPAASIVTTVKSAEPLFVFASHLSKHRALVGDVARRLGTYGIELFVAHDSIEVDAAWQDEIEKGLDRADAGLVFLHDEFPKSPWCDQEVGWLLGRHLPVFALRFDLAPYGPFGKHQAPQAANLTAEEIADATVDRIQSKPALVPQLAASLIKAMEESGSFASTDAAWSKLRKLSVLDSNQCAQLLQALKSNTQIYWADSVPDSRRPYNIVIPNFLRRQPGGTAIEADIDAYDQFLAEL